MHKDNTIHEEFKDKIDYEEDNPAVVETENVNDIDEGLQNVINAVNQLTNKNDTIDGEIKEKKNSNEPNKATMEKESVNDKDGNLFDTVPRDTNITCKEDTNSHTKLSRAAFVKVKNIHVEGKSIFVKKSTNKRFKQQNRITRNRKQPTEEVFFYG